MRSSALATRVAAPANVGSVALDPRLAAELAKAGNKSREWTSRRDEIIWLAHVDGASLREIAAAVGLSNPGVLRVIRRRQEPQTRDEHQLRAVEEIADRLAEKQAGDQ